MLPNQSIYRISPTGDSHSTILNDIDTRNLQSVRIGESAGTISKGTNNVFAGVGAGTQNTTGSYQTMIGYYAGNTAQNANYTVGIGAFALAQNKGGIENVIIGYRGGEYHISGSRIVSVGAYSGRYNYSGDGNVNVGYASGERNIEGNYNAWVGTETGQNNRSGSFNTGVGYRAGRASFMANENVYVGAYSGACNAFGNQNTFIGYGSGQYNQNGNYNTYVGAYTGTYSSLGDANTALGYNAGTNNATGSSNVWIGVSAGENAHEANGNVIIGTDAAKNIADGGYNVIIGLETALNSVGAERNVVIGAYTAQNVQGDGNTIIGYHTATNVVSGGLNTLIGIGADLYDNSNNSSIVIGPALLYGGTDSILIGSNITDQRFINVLLGNTINVNAEYVVAIGNELNIDDNIIFRDQLFRDYVNAAAQDGNVKFGIIINTNFNPPSYYNTTYTNTLVTPSNVNYSYATAALFTTNTYNSANPPSLPIPNNYLLVNQTPYYLVQQGKVLPILTLGIPTWNNTNISSDLYHNLSSLTISNPNYTSYLYTHEFQSTIGYNQANVVTNIYGSNTSSSIYKIFVPKHLQLLQMNSNHYEISFNTQYLSASNWTMTIVPTDNGIQINDTKYYYISEAPHYGTLDKAYYSKNTCNILYKPYPECLNISDDSFKIIPNQVIVDNQNYSYGRLSLSNQMTISFSNTIIPTETLVWSSLRNIHPNPDYLSIPFNLSNLWITPLQSTHTLPISVQSFDSNLTITLLGSNYSFYDSIPEFHYSNILRGDLTMSTFNGCNLSPTYFNINNNLYAISNILVHEPNPRSYTVPPTVYLSTEAFQNNTITLIPTTNSKILVYPPLNGFITSLTSSILSSSFNYQLVDPFINDSFVIGYTDESGLSNLTTQYFIQPPNQTTILPIIWQTSNLPQDLIYDISSNTYQSTIRQLNPIYNTNITSNNNIQVSFIQTPIINYNTSYGYLYITSNIWIFPSYSNWNEAGTPGNYSCNIIYQYESSNLAYNTILNTSSFNINSWNIQESYPVLSAEENSNYIYPIQIDILTSNIAAYNIYNWYYTSNINIFEKRFKDNTLFEKYISTNTLNQPIYLSNLSIPTQGYYGKSSNIDNNIVIERKYVTYYNDLILDRQNVFTYQNNSYSVQNNTPIYIINKNNERITTFTQSDINNREIRLLSPSFQNTSNFIISLNSINLSITTTIPSYYSSNSETQTLSLDTNVVYNFKNIVNTDSEWNNNSYTRIVIQAIDYGSIVKNGLRQLVFNISDIQSDLVNYIANYSILNEIISYFYTDNNYNITSDKYTKYLCLNRTGISYGQTINQAPTPYKNILDSNIFVLNNSNQGLKIQIQTSTIPNDIELIYNDVIYDNSVSTTLKIPYTQINTVQFHLQNTFNGIPIATNLTYDLLDLSDNVLTSSLSYPLTLYNQYLFPFGSNGTLYIQRIGDTPYQISLNTSLMNHLSNIQYQTDLSIYILQPPQKGILYNGLLVSDWTLNTMDSLRYISLNPDRIENDFMTVQFAYSNVLSFPYRMDIKNYIAPYRPTVIDITKPSIIARTVPPLGLSQGLIDDGYKWYSTNNILEYNPYSSVTPCNVTYQLSNQSVLTYLNLSVDCLPFSQCPTFTASTLTLYVEQANRISLTPILNYTRYDLTQSQNVWYYITNRPSFPTGIITDLSGVAYSRFSYTDLLNSNIYYQHIGTTQSDSFTLGLSSTPYDITGTLTVNIVVSTLKSVQYNPIHYLYHDTIQSALTGSHTLRPFTFEEDTTTYIHVLSTSNVSLTSSLFTPQDVLNDTVRLTLTNPTSNYFGFEFVYNNNFTINPLVYNPLYQNLFRQRWVAQLNQVIHQNIYQGTIQNLQTIQYIFNSNDIHYANLTNTISFDIVIRPKQTLLYTALSSDPTIYPDWTVINQHLNQLIRTYRFNIRLKDTLNQTILYIEFTDSSIFIQTLTQSATIPVTTKLSLTDFTTLRYINADVENNNYISLLIQDTNVLQGFEIEPIPFITIYSLSIEFNLYDPKNIYNLNTNLNYGNLPYRYNLLNFGNIFELDNFLISTIRQLTNTDTYNVVVGKTINLEGTNNIYLGNNFNTIGDNSIIVGNFIGGTTTNTANDIYQSILIGNNFFQNFAFIRNMICIGNNILNDATSFDPITLATFFNTNPIFIGNEITNDDILYQINIGKVFLKTVAGDKILLGRNQEYVGIGYLNDNWTSLAQLMVQGGIYTDRIGIGTTPQYPLDVRGITRTEYLITSNLSTSNISINDTLVVNKILVNQFVGIGTTQPITSLHVQGNSYISGCVGIGSTQPVHLLSIGAGTNTVAPLLLKSGTTLTTPSIGAVEYDGVNMYLTPTGVVRGAFTNSYLFRTNNIITIADTTGGQSLLASSTTASSSTGISLSANTSYKYEIRFVFNSIGITSHIEAIGFYYSGTTTSYNFEATRTLTNIGSSAVLYANVASGTTLTGNNVVVDMTPSITTIQTNAIYVINGWITTNTTGRWTPIIALSVAPGATSTVTNVNVVITPFQSSSSIVNISGWL